MKDQPTPDVPIGWEWASLDAVTELNPRFEIATRTDNPNVSFVPMPAVEAGTGIVDVSRTRRLEEVRKGYTHFREGDVLFAKITPCMENGKMAVVPPLENDLGFGSTEFHVLRPYRGISPQYIYHYVSSQQFRSRAQHNMTGAVGQRRVPASYVADQSVPIPPSCEQLRIVAKIEELFSELDRGIESLKTARRQLDVYRQSVLKHAFEGKLTTQWREENKDKLETPDQLRARIRRERKEHYERQLQKWKQAISGWEEAGQAGKKPRRPVTVERLTEEANARSEGLPVNWTSFCADSLGVIQLGRQRSPKNRSRDYPTKYIRAANITERGLDLDDVLDMDFRPDEVDAYRLEKADLVLSEASGSPAQVGKPAIWADQIPNCCFQNTVIRHQPHRREHAPYLYWVYRFFYLNGKFAQVAGGVGINHLSASKFSRMVVPLCSLPEQRQVVGLLEQLFSEIEQNEREIITVLEQAEVLRQSILRKAFSGQLVPQDPDDEPASILLEKIRLDREKAVRGAPTARRKRKTTPVE